MRKDWPKVRQTTNHGKKVWIVDARIAGEGERRFFDSKAEADTWKSLQQARRKNEGTSAFNDGELSKFGWTIQNAIDHAVEYLRAQAASKSIGEIVDAIIASKESDVAKGELSDARLTTIKTNLTRFKGAFGERAIATVQPEQIVEYLDGLKIEGTSTSLAKGTRNDNRRDIVMLWNYSFEKKWVASPLTKKGVPILNVPRRSPKILTPAEAARLMAESVDDDIRALNALVLFGGCRREEVEKMDWHHIHFRSGQIEVTPEVAKVGEERFAPIHPNLRAWLEPITKKSGPIVSRVISHALRATWKRAKLYPWHQDQHRHSFISYRRLICGSDAQTAQEAGTSERIIKSNYKRRAMPEDAATYFAIVPEKIDNVVSIAA